MSKKSWHYLYSNLLDKMGQGLLDRQYFSLSFNEIEIFFFLLNLHFFYRLIYHSFLSIYSEFHCEGRVKNGKYIPLTKRSAPEKTTLKQLRRKSQTRRMMTAMLTVQDLS